MEDDTKDTSLDPLMVQQAVEALIFSADEPMTVATIADVLADVTGTDPLTPEAIEQVIDALNASYRSTQRTFRLHRWGGGYRMATVPDVAPFIQAYVNPQRTKRLSRSLLETIAILAYRQPVTKPEIDAVRGVDSDYALRKLLELGLIDVVGRSESLGRPLLYGTTPRFLDVFGLADLDGLPSLREVEQILGDPGFSEERAELLMLRSLEAGSTNGTSHRDPTDEETDDASS